MSGKKTKSVKTAKPCTKTIGYNWNAHGYCVQLCDKCIIVDEYFAGNNRHSSDVTDSLPLGSSGALSTKEIERLAKIEVARLAAEHKVPKANIEVDEDIQVSAEDEEDDEDADDEIEDDEGDADEDELADEDEDEIEGDLDAEDDDEDGITFVDDDEE